MPDFNIFSVVGIEIEYMLVDRDTLEIRSVSDTILQALAGSIVNEISLGDISVSNELVMHVLELKNSHPTPITAPIASQFYDTILQLQPLLAANNLQFLPTGAHPWMLPLQETQCWPYGNRAIYQKYNEIFNCKGHGWSNLQSMHINLPFANDAEFCSLQAVVRLILPLLPAIAASTPFIEGKTTGLLDTRLDWYVKNQQKIPSITGKLIPEFVKSKAEYESTILQPMYDDINQFDPEKILQYEWLNSRGAIAKFDSMAIEIRTIDTQECVQADIVIAKAVFAILKHWHLNSELHLEKIYDTEKLKALHDQSLRHGLAAQVHDMALLEQWQLPTNKTMNMREIWYKLLEKIGGELDSKDQTTLEHILQYGNLSERLIKACAQDFSRQNLQRVYREVATCLIHNYSFNAL